MDKTIISTLISVVVGAVIASIPKIWDIYSDREKHRQSNQKLYFENKLKVLQTYVSVCTQLSASNYHNSIAIERMTYIDFFGAEDEMNSVVIANLEQNVKASMEMVLRLSEVSCAASMFIDLNINEAEAYNLIRSVHTGIAELGKIKKEVDNVIAHFKLKTEPSLNSPGGKEYFEKKEAYKRHLLQIANSYEKIKEDINRCIKLVRKEFTKYEP